jgi:hypothetical protein
LKKTSFKFGDVAGPPDGEPWIFHTLRLRKSMAWQRRSDDLKILLEFLENEHMAHGGRENGNLVAPYDDLVAAGIRRANIRATIEEGTALKLIVVERQGKNFNTGRRLPTKFRLTYLVWRNPAGTEWCAPSNDWERYRPPENGSKKTETRFRRRNSVGSASGTRAREHFKESCQSPSSAGGT